MNVTEFLGSLDPEQSIAATTERQRVRVIAGAGTGKTRTLTARIAWLLTEKKVAPTGIWAVTFTNKAAKEIKTRLVELLGDSVASGVQTGTFHSLACRILRRFPDRCGLKNKDFIVLDEDETVALIERVLDHSGVVDPYSPPQGVSKDEEKATRKAFEAERKRLARDASRRIQRWKDRGLTIDMIEDPDRPQRNADDELFARIYVVYQAALEERNAVDFGDIVLKAVRMFDADAELARYVSSKIVHLLVDEFQDTNPIQWRLIRHLMWHHGNLFVVGDLDQSLYAFRDATPVIMEALAEEGYFDVVLHRNRRCTEQILEPANLLVDHNARQVPKELRSGRDGDPVTTSAHGNEFQEAAAIVKKIRALVDEGVNAGEIAVLSRVAHVLRPIEEGLFRQGVPYTLIGGTSLLEREEIRDLVAYARLAVNPLDDLAFSRVINKPLRGLGQAALDAIVKISEARGVDYAEACGIFASSAVSRIRADAREAARSLGNLLSYLGTMHASGASAEAILRAIVAETGYLDWLRKSKEDGHIRINNVETLTDLAARRENVVEFMQELAIMTDVDADERSDAGRVRLGTVHGAKGLEFDHVFCPAFEAGIIPHPRSFYEGGGDVGDDPWLLPGGGGIEEERRIAHVAFTRARHSLHVSWSKVRGGSRGREGGGPSPFVAEAELKATYSSRAPTSFGGKVTRFSAQKPSGGRSVFGSNRF
jgi:DNA helicase-2/ATP-dependent DNA helicase PcrA